MLVCSPQDFVRSEPSAFDESYWLVNSVVVYGNTSSAGAHK
eukprot:COSAG04_NODE_65_length_29645_cov_11.027483_9_plen_41_part_00